MQLAVQFHAIHARHAHIRQDAVESLRAGQFERVRAGISFDRLAPGDRKDIGQGARHALVIVDD
jgi:hypothetical protein